MKKKLGDYPEWVQAEEKFIELQTERDQYAKDQRDTETIKNRLAEERSSLLEREAQAMLGGEQVGAADIQDLYDKIANYARRHQVVCKAIEIHKKNMADLRGKLSREILEALKPEYKELQIAIAKKAIELATLTEEENKFRDELEAGGILLCFMATNPLRALGRVDNKYGRLNYWLQEGEKAGYFNRSSL